MRHLRRSRGRRTKVCRQQDSIQMNFCVVLVLLNEVMLRRAQGEDGAGSLCNYFFCGRSPQGARVPFVAMPDDGYQVNVVITHRARNLRRRLTFDDYWFNLETFEE